LSRFRKAEVSIEFLLAISMLLVIFTAVYFATEVQKENFSQKMKYEKCKNLANVIDQVYLSEGASITYELDSTVKIYKNTIDFDGVLCTFLYSAEEKTLSPGKITIYEEQGMVRFA